MTWPLVPSRGYGGWREYGSAPGGWRRRRGREACGLGIPIGAAWLCAAATAAALLGGIPAASGVPASPPGPTPASHLRAGAASEALRLPAEVPLAGYGSVARRPWLPDLLGRHPPAFWFRPSVGTRDAVMGRALVLERAGERLLWITADLIGVDGAFTADLAAHLRARGLVFSAVIASASHTHSGPGGYVDSIPLGLLVLDRFAAGVRAELLDGLADTAAAAARGVEPARVGTGTVAAPPVIRSRLDLELDSEIVLVKLVRSDGRPLAAVWNYAIHGTMLGPQNLRLSGDVMGVASARIERALGVPALYVNGAVGDVSPSQHGEQALAEVGPRLAAAVVSAWPRLATRPGARLTIAREHIDLPAPFLSVRNCVGRWVPEWLRVPLAGTLPRSAELVGVSLGEAAAVTIPGELQTALGQRLKAAGRSRAQVALVAGMSNGYLGYLLTAQAYDRVGYTACSSLYGAGEGERITTAAGRLLERLGTAGYESEASRRARADFLRAAVLR